MKYSIFLTTSILLLIHLLSSQNLPPTLITLKSGEIYNLNLEPTFPEEKSIKSSSEAARFILEGRQVSERDITEDTSDCRRFKISETETTEETYIIYSICQESKLAQFEVDRSTGDSSLKAINEIWSYPNPFYAKEKNQIVTFSRDQEEPEKLYYVAFLEGEEEKEEEEVLDMSSFERKLKDSIGVETFKNQNNEKTEFIAYERSLSEEAYGTDLIALTKIKEKQLPLLKSLGEFLKIDGLLVERIYKIELIREKTQNYVFFYGRKVDLTPFLYICKPEQNLIGVEDCKDIKQTPSIKTGQVRITKDKLVYFGIDKEAKKVNFWICDLDLKEAIASNCNEKSWGLNESFFKKIFTENSIGDIKSVNGKLWVEILSKRSKLPIMMVSNLDKSKSEMEIYEELAAELFLPLESASVLIFKPDFVTVKEINHDNKLLAIFSGELSEGETRIELTQEENESKLEILVKVVEDGFTKKGFLGKEPLFFYRDEEYKISLYRKNFEGNNLKFLTKENSPINKISSDETKILEMPQEPEGMKFVELKMIDPHFGVSVYQKLQPEEEQENYSYSFYFTKCENQKCIFLYKHALKIEEEITIFKVYSSGSLIYPGIVLLVAEFSGLNHFVFFNTETIEVSEASVFTSADATSSLSFLAAEGEEVSCLAVAQKKEFTVSLYLVNEMDLSNFEEDPWKYIDSESYGIPENEFCPTELQVYGKTGLDVISSCNEEKRVYSWDLIKDKGKFLNIVDSRLAEEKNDISVCRNGVSAAVLSKAGQNVILIDENGSDLDFGFERLNFGNVGRLVCFEQESLMVITSEKEDKAVIAHLIEKPNAENRFLDSVELPGEGEISVHLEGENMVFTRKVEGENLVVVVKKNLEKIEFSFFSNNYNKSHKKILAKENADFTLKNEGGEKEINLGVELVKFEAGVKIEYNGEKVLLKEKNEIEKKILIKGPVISASLNQPESSKSKLTLHPRVRIVPEPKTLLAMKNNYLSDEETEKEELFEFESFIEDYFYVVTKKQGEKKKLRVFEKGTFFSEMFLPKNCYKSSLTLSPDFLYVVLGCSHRGNNFLRVVSTKRSDRAQKTIDIKIGLFKNILTAADTEQKLLIAIQKDLSLDLYQVTQKGDEDLKSLKLKGLDSSNIFFIYRSGIGCLD